MESVRGKNDGMIYEKHTGRVVSIDTLDKGRNVFRSAFESKHFYCLSVAKREIEQRSVKRWVVR